jgi:hypothetical protein
MKKQVKFIAFEYLLYKLAAWYIHANRIKSWQKFNLCNDLGEEKILLLPFFICMANKKSLSVFDTFIASKDGVIEQDILQYSSENSFPHLCIIDGECPYPWDELGNDLIEKCSLGFSETKKVPLSKEYSGFPYELIDESVDRLQRNNPDFINHNVETLSAYSRDSICWSTCKGNPIPLKELETEKFIFSGNQLALLY